jgi:hypothetical protein
MSPRVKKAARFLASPLCRRRCQILDAENIPMKGECLNTFAVLKPHTQRCSVAIPLLLQAAVSAGTLLNRMHNGNIYGQLVLHKVRKGLRSFSCNLATKTLHQYDTFIFPRFRNRKIYIAVFLLARTSSFCELSRSISILLSPSLVFALTFDLLSHNLFRSFQCCHASSLLASSNPTLIRDVHAPSLLVPSNPPLIGDVHASCGGMNGCGSANLMPRVRCLEWRWSTTDERLPTSSCGWLPTGTRPRTYSIT